jgi:RNA polymerase sigma-70 factor (ECF subfamily)
VGSDDEALDIVQDAMMKLAQRYSNRDTSEWGPLFHRILQSKIRDWYRRAKVRNKWRGWLGSSYQREDDDTDPIEQVPDLSARAPEQELETQQNLEILEVAIGNLPARQQQAFILRSWEGLDVAQTANAMGCSTGSVKTHYSRALQFLRSKLDDD